MKTSNTICGPYRRGGMSLLEVLIVLAVIVILLGAVVTAGKTLRLRAETDLTRSLLEVLDTALQQYYDDFGKFPFVTHVNFGTLIADTNSDGYYLDEFIGPYAVHSGTVPKNINFEANVAMFYFLDKNPNSRSIAAAVSDSLVTNKIAGTLPIQLTLNGQVIDLPAYIDSWQTSIRYQYIDGTAFPVLTSAGPDKIFDNSDDVTNK